MGVVYRARDVRLDRVVALKIVRDEFLDPLLRERFQIEAEAVARLRHPGIVTVHELGVDGHAPYLVMDMIEGESLDARLKRDGPLDPHDAAQIAIELAAALEHAHGQSILHRDVKPANVLLAKDGRAVLTDFGLAKDLSATRERLTLTGELIGTLAFMPPEQAGSGDPVGVGADVYSLGATLYCMLAGRPPFEGSNAINVAFRVLKNDPVPPSTHRAGVPRGLEAVVMRCLAKGAADRYPSAAALAEDLRRFQRGDLTRDESPRGNLAPKLAAGAVLLALALGAARIGPRAPGPSEADLAPVPSAPTTAPPPKADLQATRAGDRRLRKLRRVESAASRHADAKHWLAEFPDHPETETVERIRADARARFPRWRLERWEGKRPLGFDVVGEEIVCAYEGGKVVRHVLLPDGSTTVARTWVTALDQAPELLVSADGRRALVVGTEKSVPTGYVLDLHGEAPAVGLSLPFAPDALGASPSGFRVALGGKGKTVVVWDLERPRVPGVARLPGHNSPLRSLVFSPDGKLLLSSCGQLNAPTRDPENRVRVWELGADTTVATFDFPGRPDELAFIDGGSRFAVGTVTGHIEIFDTTTRKLLHALRSIEAGADEFEHLEGPRAHEGPLRSLHPLDGGRLLSISATRGKGSRRRPAVLRVWNARYEPEFFTPLEGEPRKSCLSARGRWVAIWIQREPDAAKTLSDVSIEVWPLVPAPGN